MPHFSSLIKATVLTSCLLLPLSISANEFEITPFFGQMYGSDLIAIDNETTISVDSATNYGIAVAWQESPNGQGQILLNVLSHDFTSEFGDDSLDIIYAHFNGVAQFRQQSYVTTVSLGLGGAYFDAIGGQELYPSATIAFGTRYEFSENLSLITELRGYASLVDEKDNIFCKSENCSAQFDDTLWVDTTISIGFAYKF